MGNRKLNAILRWARETEPGMKMEHVTFWLLCLAETCDLTLYSAKKLGETVALYYGLNPEQRYGLDDEDE